MALAASLLPLRICAAARPATREAACSRPPALQSVAQGAGGRSGRHCARKALYDGSGEMDTAEKEDMVSSAFKERVASAASTGSSDSELAARIASGEFSNTSPLVEALKPLRKWLAQLPGPGACLKLRGCPGAAVKPIGGGLVG